MERVRIRAVRLLRKGMAPVEVARKLAVTKQAVFRWKTNRKKDGLNGVRFPGWAWRKPSLGPQELMQLEAELLKGPKAQRYGTELWTGRRVLKLIWKLFGVKYQPHHMRWVMRSMGWTCQRSRARARRRDEEAIRPWKRRGWGRIEERPEKEGHDRVCG